MFPSACCQHIATDVPFMQKHLKDVLYAARKYDFDTFVGCGFGSIPWVVLLSAHTGKPYVMVRKASEKPVLSFTGRVIGRFGHGRRCLFVDDVVASGGTRYTVERELFHEEAVLVGTIELTAAIPMFGSRAVDHRREVEKV